MRKVLVFLSVYLLILSPALLATENTTVEVRKITPPRLSSKNIGKKVVCYRPMRRGSPNLSISTWKNKIVAHNYGHGASGCSLAPGSALYVVDLLETRLKKEGKSKKTPITVIGSGIIGLFTAKELLDRGYTHLTIVAKKFQDLPSQKAEGIFEPVFMEYDPDMKIILDKIGRDGYKIYTKIAHGEYLKKGR